MASTKVSAMISKFRDKINHAIDEIAVNSIAPSIKEELIEEYNDQVYDSYFPSMYDRRETLISEDSYNVSYSGKVLVITPAMKPSDSLLGHPLENSNITLADWIERGSIPNIFNDGDYPWMKPRPVFKTVSDRLIRENTVRDILAIELKKRGINVKGGI